MRMPDHKHDFIWYIAQANTKRAHKKIVCSICRKSLSDVIDEILNEVKRKYRLVR